MNPRPFAWTAGIILLLLGVAGFIPPLTPVEADPLRKAAGVGGPHLLGLLPVSPVLSGIHVLLGAWGVYAGTRLGRAVWFARRAAVLAAILLVMGTIPGADTLFGMAPLYGNNLLLHGLLAILCFLFGWLYRRPAAPPAGEAEAEAAAEG
jgi:hypothetical protein